MAGHRSRGGRADQQWKVASQVVTLDQISGGRGQDARDIKAWLAKRSDGREYDILAEGQTPPDDPVAA